MKSVVGPEHPAPEHPFDDDTQAQCLQAPRSNTLRWMYRKVPNVSSFRGPIAVHEPQALAYHLCAEGVTRSGLIAALTQEEKKKLLKDKELPQAASAFPVGAQLDGLTSWWRSMHGSQRALSSCLKHLTQVEHPRQTTGYQTRWKACRQ